ncbi:MAG: YIP1 family protein [Acidobacteria bacterium]|nr:YIP1 family protein [Acidobacteriota bacterium]
MNDETPETNGSENLQEDWQAPPLPEEINAEVKEEPQMSEVSTLANIFFEPGKTFEDLRRKPRFIMAFVIIALITTAYIFSFNYKMGEERIRRFSTVQAEKNAQFQALTPEQKKQNIDISMTIQKVISYALPIFLLIGVLIGSLVYWLGAKAMGSARFGFLQSVSVWVYSSLPPTLVAMAANLLVLALKSADDIDIATSSRGLIKANPTLFIGGKDMPVLTTLISSIDVFAIWGLILAAIGLRKVAKLSKGSAWGIVLIFALLGITMRVLFALLNGIPQ